MIAKTMFAVLFAMACLSCAETNAVHVPRSPNILLIVADDLGFSDLGCYGGEIETPNLDRLAEGGLRLTQFYTTGRCCPSRASILTGYYPHRVGLGHMTKDIGQPGYRGRVSTDVKTIAEHLNALGYRSFLSGKWHLGTDDPTRHGFEEFYGTLVSAKTFWDHNHMLRLPKDRARRIYADGEFYATDAVVDHAIDFLKVARETPDKPWFLYLAFHAPHFPLHAPKEVIEKYADRYHKGWDVLRAERLERMKQLGVVPKETRLTPRSKFYDWGEAEGVANPAWKSLSDERRADLARRMAIYAAMVDRLDQNIGRVLADLEEHKEFDNTLIIFTSDNGACAEWDPFGFDTKSGPTNILHRGDQIEQMGSSATYHSVGSGWANASNTPWRLYKHYNHEGGIAAPCVVHWPAGMNRQAGAIDATPTHLIDLAQTFLAATKAKPSVTEPLPGHSLLPLLNAERLPDRKLFFEHEGHRAVRHGSWKLVALRGKAWELYDMLSDRSECKNVASRRSNQVKRLELAWNEWAKSNQVTPLPKDYGVAYVPVSDEYSVKPTSAVRKLADGFRFTEGPAWDGKGAWYFSDLPNKTLHRWTGDEGVELIRTGEDAFSNGIVIDAKGRLVFCDVASRRIIRRTPDGEEETIADRCDGKPIGMPNDLWLAPDGAIYFTIPRTNQRRAKVVPPDAINGTVCRVSPDGKTVTDVGVGLKSPNGIVGTRDGKWLFVADPGSQKCWRYAIGNDGRLSDQQVAAEQGSDGLAIDEHENLYATGREGVVVYSPQAKQITVIPVPERPANMKFGGKDGYTLFITARTGIYAVEMNVRGG